MHLIPRHATSMQFIAYAVKPSGATAKPVHHGAMSVVSSKSCRAKHNSSKVRSHFGSSFVVQNSVPESAHEETLAPAGNVSEEWFACVHMPISMDKVRKNPKAQEAVDAEWEKLAKLRAWILESVEERRDVEARAIREKRTIHFGSLMDLCHLKHAELDVSKQKYTGSV